MHYRWRRKSRGKAHRYLLDPTDGAQSSRLPLCKRPVPFVETYEQTEGEVPLCMDCAAFVADPAVTVLYRRLKREARQFEAESVLTGG